MRQRQHKDKLRREVWEYRLHSVTSSWKAILLLIALGAGVILFGRFVIQTAKAPAEIEMGRVIRFGSYAFDDGDRPLIIVALSNGSTRQFRIRRPQLQTCRTGDSIRLIRKGEVLKIHPRACLAD